MADILICIKNKKINKNINLKISDNAKRNRK